MKHLAMRLLLSAMMFPVTFLAWAGPAWSEDARAPQPMEAEFCFPTDDIADMLRKFDELKPSKRDTVGADFAVRFDLEDGEAMPERVELRSPGQVRDIALDADGRSVGLPDAIRSAPDDAALCVVDPARAGRMRDEIGYGLVMGLSVRFLDTPGTHTLETIEDGLKDGRSHYKKMVGAMGFMVPKFDHVAVAGPDADNPPRVWATANGTNIAEPAFELYDGARMIDIDALEDLGADGIRIDGADYRISPSPDAKTVAKFTSDD